MWGHTTNSFSGVCVISGLKGLNIQCIPPLSSEIMSEVHVEHDMEGVWISESYLEEIHAGEPFSPEHLYWPLCRGK